jgi:hypothetical protein
VFSRPTIGDVNRFTSYTEVYDERALRNALQEAHMAADVTRPVIIAPDEPEILYDLQGRRVASSEFLSPGIYIRGGKKVLVK